MPLTRRVLDGRASTLVASSGCSRRLAANSNAACRCEPVALYVMMSECCKTRMVGTSKEARPSSYCRALAEVLVFSPSSGWPEAFTHLVPKVGCYDYTMGRRPPPIVRGFSVSLRRHPPCRPPAKAQARLATNLATPALLSARPPRCPNPPRGEQAALAAREPLMRKLMEEKTDCYRLFHGAVEGCPGLTVDRYGTVSRAIRRRHLAFAGRRGVCLCIVVWVFLPLPLSLSCPLPSMRFSDSPQTPSNPGSVPYGQYPCSCQLTRTGGASSNLPGPAVRLRRIGGRGHLQTSIGRDKRSRGRGSPNKWCEK